MSVSFDSEDEGQSRTGRYIRTGSEVERRKEKLKKGTLQKRRSEGPELRVEVGDAYIREIGDS